MKEIKLKDVNFDDFDWSKANYETITEGSDDIIIVKNYPQRYIYNINKDFDERDILGYKIVEGDTNNDRVILIEKTESRIHVVQPGETLHTLSKKYNVSEESIKKGNKIKEVFIGQMIKID